MALKHNSKVGKKFIKNARNVLAIPKESFWPTLDDETNSPFLNTFIDSMKSAKTISLKLPWSKARRLSKEERKRQIQELYKNLAPESISSHQKAMLLRKCLALGVNDVCRSLEKEELACCLICGEAKPKLLVTHLIDLAKAKMTPLLVLNSLKDLLLQSLGFTSLAVGFKKEILSDPNHEMNSLCGSVLHLFNEKYTLDFESTKINEEYTASDLKLMTGQGKGWNDVKKFESPLDLNDIYLYRESTTYRVFKPNEEENSGKNLTEPNNMDVDGNDSTSDEGDGKGIIKKARYYKPPTIRKVQINPNKIRKHKKKK